MMRHSLVLMVAAGLSGLGMVSTPALAAGPAGYWTGAYVGLQGGYSKATAEFTAPGETVPFGTIDMTGWVWGARGGLDMQSGNIVFGLLGDVNFSNINANVINLGGGGSDVNATIDRVGSFRGRIGMAMNNWMIYGTAGLGVAHVNATVTNLAPGDTGSDTASNTHVGWTAGIGAEMALTSNLTLGAEWLYSDYGSRLYHFDDGVGTIDANTGIKSNAFLVSLNMRFK
jgi:outer membrane immunogenic protein